MNNKFIQIINQFKKIGFNCRKIDDYTFEISPNIDLNNKNIICFCFYVENEKMVIEDMSYINYDISVLHSKIIDYIENVFGVRLWIDYFQKDINDIMDVLLFFHCIYSLSLELYDNKLQDGFYSNLLDNECFGN